MRLIAALLFVMLGAASLDAEPATNAIVQPRQLPVILLTGFEPFGPGRPANPSWEGIRRLDGQQWRGYRLAARELKVEWGAPLLTLKKLIDELRPAAVFSFGQGGDFTIETLAQNQRGAYADNSGRLPAEPNIAPDGPAEYRATIDAEALAKQLEAKHNRRVRLSAEAGDYLCEETLYSLEHLKANGNMPLTVAFCHVPPLRAASSNQATAAAIESFVKDVLAAWEAIQAPASISGKTSGEDAPSVIARQAAPDPREKEVRELIDRYFKSWSNQDLVRYGQCFMPQAAIQLIDPQGRLITMPLGPFLKEQQELQRNAKQRMTETAEQTTIRFDAELAHALVYWKLVNGERLEYGYDHFTLMKSNGRWRIVNLVFYPVDAPLEMKNKK